MLRGKRIAQLRKRKGWAQKELAEHSSVEQSYLSMLERDKRENPSLDKLKAIADALETSVDYLVGRTNDPHPIPESTDVPIHPATLEIVYRLGHLSELIREKYTGYILSMLDMAKDIEEEMARVRIIGGELDGEEMGEEEVEEELPAKEADEKVA